MITAKEIDKLMSDMMSNLKIPTKGISYQASDAASKNKHGMYEYEISNYTDNTYDDKNNYKIDSGGWTEKNFNEWLMSATTTIEKPIEKPSTELLWHNEGTSVIWVTYQNVIRKLSKRFNKDAGGNLLLPVPGSSILLKPTDFKWNEKEELWECYLNIDGVSNTFIIRKRDQLSKP